MNALLIIDMQDAYFKTVGLQSRKPHLIRHINQAVADARRNDDLVISIQTVHKTDKSTWTLNMLEDNQGFAFADSDEVDIVEGLRLDNALRVAKTRDSAFHGTNLLDLLREHDVEKVTLAGVSTHSCIFHTAAAAYAYDIKVNILENCVDDEDKSAHREALDYLRREYRQKIISYK